MKVFGWDDIGELLGGPEDSSGEDGEDGEDGEGEGAEEYEWWDRLWDPLTIPHGDEEAAEEIIMANQIRSWKVRWEKLKAVGKKNDSFEKFEKFENFFYSIFFFKPNLMKEKERGLKSDKITGFGGFNKGNFWKFKKNGDLMLRRMSLVEY